MVSPVILLSISAVFHAAWNAVLKKTQDKDFALLVTVVLATVFSLLISPFLNESGQVTWQNGRYAIAAGFCEGFYFYCLGKSLARAPLGKAYIIMRGGAMCIVWFVSILFLNEQIKMVGALGVIFVFLGLILTQSLVEYKERAEFRWAYLCSIFIGGYHLLYGEAIRENIQPSATFIIALMVSIPMMFYNCRHDFRKRLKFVKEKQAHLAFVAGLACSLSFIIFLHGLSSSSPGVAITIRNSSIVYSQVFAFWLGEKITARQWMGATLVLIGCAMMGQN